jgi:hypothetical protein
LNKKIHPLTLIAITLLIGYASAQENANKLVDWWEAHGDYSIKNLSSGIQREYAEIPLNQDNLLNIPEFTLLNEFRPEASVSFEHAFFQIKPRFTSKRVYFKSGEFDGDKKSDSDTYVNEWIAQFFVTHELSISYGREDLQWGPAFLLSPSNPFDSRNGRTQPNTEVAGSDYAKITWTPSRDWTISGIVNTDDGRKDYRIRKEIEQDFRNIYALKIDYLFERGNAAVILSQTDENEDQDTRIGYYISYNVNDAFIAYSDGSASEEDEEFLIGNTYTFISGLSISSEYFYNSSGLLDSVPTDFGDIIDLEDNILSQPNREAFIRKNYMLLQAYQNDVYGSLDLLLRYTYNLDDSSRSLLAHLTFDINDNMEFFSSATINSDGQGELDAQHDYWIQSGIEISF